MQECLEKVDEDRANAIKSAMYVLNSKGKPRNYFAPNSPESSDGVSDICKAISDALKSQSAVRE